MAAFDEQPMSGMAGEIRACTTSEQFDFAGVSQTRVIDTIKNGKSVCLSLYLYICITVFLPFLTPLLYPLSF